MERPRNIVPQPIISCILCSIGYCPINLNTPRISVNAVMRLIPSNLVEGCRSSENDHVRLHIFRKQFKTQVGLKTRHQRTVSRRFIGLYSHNTPAPSRIGREFSKRLFLKRSKRSSTRRLVLNNSSEFNIESA